MNKHRPLRALTTIAAILSVSLASAEDAPPRTELFSHWTRSTVSLGRLDDNQHYTTLGSAVVVATDKKQACILTARHMVDDPTLNWKPTEIRMRLSRNTATDTSNDQGVNVPLIVNNVPIWKTLDNDSDLAVIPLQDLSKYSDVHAIGIKNFGTSEDDVFQGAAVLVLGYPGVIGEEPLSFPILRSGIVAWTDPADKLGRPFLVDANIMPGNSGGPVFHIPRYNRFGDLLFNGGPLSLVGIVSKVPLQNVAVHITNGLASAQDLQWKLKGLSGLGIIEPASKVKKLVEQNCGAQPKSPVESPTAQ